MELPRPYGDENRQDRPPVAVGEVDAGEVATLSDELLVERIEQIEAAERRLEAAKLAAVGEFDHRGLAAPGGLGQSEPSR